METVKRLLDARTGRQTVKQVAVLLAAAAVGFFLAGIVFEDRIAPFGAAFAAGVPSFALIPACMGAAAGAFVFCPPLVTLEYVGAVALIFLFRVSVPRLFPAAQNRYTLPAAGFFSVLICAGVVSFVDAPSMESLLLSLCEGAITGAAAAFWNRVFVLLPGGSRLSAASAGDTAAFVFAGAMLLLSFDRYAIGGVSPARIVAFFVVMLLGLCAGEAAGAVGGVCAGLVLGFSPERTHLVFSLPAAGLLCGVVSPAGKLAVDAAFAVCDLLFLMLRGAPEHASAALIETAVAVGLFLLLPRRAVTLAGEYLRPFSRRGGEGEAGRLLGLRLRRAAKAVTEISDAVAAVERFADKNRPSAGDALPAAVRESVCADCVKRSFCWERARLLTARDFAAAAEKLRTTGALTTAMLPERLSSVCAAPEALCDGFNRQLCFAAAREAARTEVRDAKTAAAAQFRQVAALLADAAADAERAGGTDPVLAGAAETVFTGAGFTLTSVLAGADDNGRCTLELLCKKLPPEPDYDALLHALNETAALTFSRPTGETYPGFGTLLTFCEKPALRAEFYRCAAKSSPDHPSGDACEGFSDGRGGFYCILSDGMGTGTEAAVEAAMTCSLAGRLLRARFSMEAAVEAVNAALMVNAADETMTTLDVFRLDLYSGDAVFYKAGASFSAVRMGTKTAVVEKSALPLGILGGARFEKTELRLSVGDAALIMSDGADLLPAQFFKDLFYLNRNADAKTLAERVLAEARKRAPVGRADDITVACVVVRDNGNGGRN